MRINRSTNGRYFYILLPVLFLVAALWPSLNSPLAEESIHKTLPVGNDAPFFTSFTIDGQPFDLETQLSEKPVVIFFWSFFCGPCREEMPIIQQLYEEFKDKSLEIISLNLDETPLHTPVKNYLIQSGFTYPTVVNKYENKDARIDKLYLVTGTPTIYMIRQNGKISFAHVGRITPDELRKAIEENLLTPAG